MTLAPHYLSSISLLTFQQIALIMLRNSADAGERRGTAMIFATVFSINNAASFGLLLGRRFPPGTPAAC
jgi:hypothetical protein